jgi:hypothetical protein
MQRFSKTIRKNQRCKGSRKPYEKTKDVKVLENHTKKPKMQRFSNTIRKNQRCKGSQIPYEKNIQCKGSQIPYEKTKDAKVLKYHDKNTLTKKKTNSCIFTLFNIYNYFYKNHTKKHTMQRFSKQR